METAIEQPKPLSREIQDTPLVQRVGEQVTIVIPTLNEEKALGKVIEDLKTEGYNNILVIDGYSNDRTAEIAKANGVRILGQHGVGKAGALRTALEHVDTDYMVVMDGDCTYKASDICRLLAHAKNYDEVIGARTKGRDNIPFMNRLGNWLISKTFKLLFSKTISDVLSGMYLVRTQKLRDAGELTSNSFDVEVEIATAIASEGDITEVPISYGERLGKQKLRKRDAFRILSTLIWMANYFNPVLLYGGIISLAAIPAAGILIWAFYQYVFFNIWHSQYVVVSGILFLFAAQAAAVSMMSLLVKRSESRIIRLMRKNHIL